MLHVNDTVEQNYLVNMDLDVSLVHFQDLLHYRDRPLALVRHELYFNAIQLAVPFPQRSYGVLVQLVNKEQAIPSSYLQSRGFKDRWSLTFYHTPCWKRMISGLSTVASSMMSLETSNIKNYLYLK